MTAALLVPPLEPGGPRYSASQIETFRLCQRKWAYSRAIPKPGSPAAQLGNEVHWCMELWTRDGKPPAAAPIVIDTHGRYLSGATPRAVEIAKHLVPHAPLPRTVETESELRIVRSAATYTGRRDYVRPATLANVAEFARHLPAADQREIDRLLDSEGTVLRLFPIVGDYKTTSDLKWAMDAQALRKNVAANIYAEAEMQASGSDVCGLEWPYITSSPPYRVRVVRLVVYRPDVEQVLRLVDDTAHEMRPWHGQPIESVPRTMSACDAFGGCPYLAECGPTASQRMGSIMSQQTLADRLRSKIDPNAAGAAAPARPATPITAGAGPSTTPAPAAAATPAGPPASAPVGSLAAKLAARKAAEGASAVTPPGVPAGAATAPPENIEQAVARDTDARRFTPEEQAAARAIIRQGVHPSSGMPAKQSAALPVDTIADKHTIGGLRDQIAISALNGILARGGFNPGTREQLIVYVSQEAYAYADAMLAARIA